MNNYFAIIILLFLTVFLISCSKEPIQESNTASISQNFEKTFGGLQNDIANSILIKNDEIYIFGTTKSLGNINGDSYLIKTD
ncbi:MAG: hypothetical protein HRT73_14855, partial [Flavobacteriales bacterium]|nr:hypothetical protein [Flavobacteriales bacterium]